LQVAILGPRIVRVARGDERQAGPAREAAQFVVQPTVVGQPRALDLDPEMPGAENVAQSAQLRRGVVAVIAQDGGGDRAATAPGQALQSRRMGGHVVEGGARLSLGAGQVGA